MKATKVYFSREHPDKDKRRYVSCDVIVPGLGKLEIYDCLSDETMDRVFAEVEAATAMKLHIKDE